MAEEINSALNVAELLSELRLDGPVGPLRLKGKVRDLRRLPEEDPKFVCGYLSDTTSKGMIRFRCDLDVGPRFDGQYVIMEGSLDVLPAQLHSGLEVVLRGLVLSDFRPNAPDDPNSFLAVARKRAKIPLDRLDFSALKDLTVLGSRQALAEASERFEQFGLRARWRAIVLPELEPDALVDCLRQWAAQSRAVIWVLTGQERGLIEAANYLPLAAAVAEVDVPTYVALGRPAELSLVDRLADESFPSAGAVGAALAAAMINRRRRALEATRLKETEEQKDRALVRLQALSDVQDSIQGRLDSSRKEAARSKRHIRFYRYAIMVIVIVFLLAIGWLSQSYWSPLARQILASDVARAVFETAQIGRPAERPGKQ